MKKIIILLFIILQQLFSMEKCDYNNFEKAIEHCDSKPFEIYVSQLQSTQQESLEEMGKLVQFPSEQLEKIVQTQEESLAKSTAYYFTRFTLLGLGLSCVLSKKQSLIERAVIFFPVIAWTCSMVNFYKNIRLDNIKKNLKIIKNKNINLIEQLKPNLSDYVINGDFERAEQLIKIGIDPGECTVGEKKVKLIASSLEERQIPLLYYPICDANIEILKLFARYNINMKYIKQRTTDYVISHVFEINQITSVSKPVYEWKYIFHAIVNLNWSKILKDTEKDYDSIISFLIEHGADINIVRGDDETPLSIALKCNRSSGYIMLLLHNGADPGHTSVNRWKKKWTIEYPQIALECPVFQSHFIKMCDLLQLFKLPKQILEPQSTLLRTVIKNIYEKNNYDIVKTAKIIASKIDAQAFAHLEKCNKRELQENALTFLKFYFPEK